MSRIKHIFVALSLLILASFAEDTKKITITKPSEVSDAWQPYNVNDNAASYFELILNTKQCVTIATKFDDPNIDLTFAKLEPLFLVRFAHNFDNGHEARIVGLYMTGFYGVEKPQVEFFKVPSASPDPSSKPLIGSRLQIKKRSKSGESKIAFDENAEIFYIKSSNQSLFSSVIIEGFKNIVHSHVKRMPDGTFRYTASEEVKITFRYVVVDSWSNQEFLTNERVIVFKI